MTPKRIVIFNCVVFVLFLTLSVYILMQERQLPGEPPVKEAQREVLAMVVREGERVDDTEERLPNLGKRNVFETILPLPTPTPAPTRTPDPGPHINEVTDTWKLSVAFRDFATFQDIKTQQDFTLKLGESKPVEFKGKEYRVMLESIDSKKFSATIMMKNLIGEEQRKSFKMF